MARNSNTNRNGGSWTESEKKSVWKKGKVITGLDSDIWRNDKCGKRMKYSQHGNRDSIYGWEIDHINPVSNGGGDNLDNFQPLHWENNSAKSDSLNWSCP